MASGVMVFVCLMLIWRAPSIVQGVQKRRRVSRLRHALDAELDGIFAVLARQLRAGHDLGRALREAQASKSGVVYDELMQWQHERQVTLSLGRVLLQRGERLQIEALKIAGATLVVRDSLGGPLAHTLDELSRSLRDARSLRLKIEAASATHRMQASMLSILIPLLSASAIALTPGATWAVLQTTPGHLLLLIAGCLMSIGHLWVRRLCHVQ